MTTANTMSKAYEEASKGIASMLFTTELAYEISVRYTPIIKTNSAIFKQELKHKLGKFQSAMKTYNNWLVAATKDCYHLTIIRQISDELNNYADDEVYKLMLSVQNLYEKQGIEHSATLARIEIIYYILTLASMNANRCIEGIRPTFPTIRHFEPMALYKPFNMFQDIWSEVVLTKAKVCVVNDKSAKMIEAGLTAIMRQIMEHCNDVCRELNVEL